MGSSRKKVIVRTRKQETLAGYLPVSGFVDAAGVVELLDLSGRLVGVPLGEVRTICFVRDFNLGEKANPEGLVRRTFLARPRSDGLWVRVTFAEGDELEGLAAVDLGLLDGVLEDRGVFLAPPDLRGNTQRVFVPRAAISGLVVLGVIATAAAVKVVKPGKVKVIGQGGLFGE